jgi:transposase
MKKVLCVSSPEQVGKREEVRPLPGEDVYVAVDLSRSKWVYGLRWGGQDRRQLSSPGALSHLQALVELYRDCALHVVYEACGFGYEIAWWLEEQAIDVMVIAPSRVERVPGAGVKTDRVDVRAMARKREQGQLKGIYIPRRSEHERRQLSRTYAQALKECKRARMRVRSLLQEQGRIGPEPQAGWAAYERWLAAQSLPAPVAMCVEELLTLRAAARGSAARLKREILKLAAEPEYAPVVCAMAQQPGVGTFTAIRLVLELGQLTRFRTADSIVNYLGLTPSQYSSGETDHRGHLLKWGPGYLRAWMLQCAWASLRGAHADPRLQQCFMRLHPRVGKKRAIVAVARRLAVRLRARWRESVAVRAPHPAAVPGS